jgi:PII-like signaling protein
MLSTRFASFEVLHCSRPSTRWEADMIGYQLTFYTEQNRRHGHQTICEWLLSQVHKLKIGGATVISATEGVGHAGAHHAAHFISLADQPVQIIMAVTETEAEQLLQIVAAEKVHVFYTRFPIEFGLLGGDDAIPHGSRFDWLRHSLHKKDAPRKP